MEAIGAKKASLTLFEEWIDGATIQKDQYRGFPADNAETAATGFAWSLYSHILKLFETLFPVALRWPQVADKSMRDSLGKLLLWGDELGDGQLEQILDESDELKELILDSLAELGGVLMSRLVPICQSFAQPEEDTHIQDLVKELNVLLEKVGLLNKNDCEGSSVSNVDAAGTESVAHDQDDIFLSLSIYTASLIELLPSMENTLDYICNSKEEETIQPVKFEVSGPAQSYVLHVHDQFPNAESRLIERLGEANWQRHTSLREIAPEINTLESLAAAKSVSEFLDSGLGTSVPAPPSFGQIGPKSVFAPLSIIKVAEQSTRAKSVASHSSFISTASDIDKISLRVPPTPKEVADGIPFTCYICTRKVDGIKNRIDWKRHVFEDLNPYLCTFSGCKEELVMFPTRKLWEEHEFAHHRHSRVWVCPECPQSLSSLENWKTHVNSAHDVLFSGAQYKAMIAVVEHKIPQDVESLQCPLCLSLPKKSRKYFTTHVAKHMERIALAALPREAEVDTDDASDGATSGEDPGLRIGSNHSINPGDFVLQEVTPKESQNFEKTLNGGNDSTAAEFKYWGSDEGDPKDVILRKNADFSGRRAFQDHEQRTTMAQTRKYTACIRCRTQRLRCIPDPSNPMGICLTCQRISRGISIEKYPCLRYKISEVRLFRPGPVPGLEWTRRWPDSKLVDITKWVSNEKRTIQTTDVYSSKPMTLEVREFVPVKGDVLNIQWWVAGVRKEVSVPPYALADVTVARQAYRDHAVVAGAEIFKKGVNEMDYLFSRTYSMAIVTSNNPETPDKEKYLLRLVFHLWVVTRLASRSFRICGEETLGMPQDILDETSPLHGEIPLPPVMSAQIELILIQEILVPVQKEVLDLLQKLILSNRRESWFTLYLCTFILLHNCSSIIECDARCARDYDFKRRFAWPKMVEELHFGANVLLAHWHYCNRGQLPFSTELESTRTSSSTQISLYPAEFLKETTRYVKDHEHEFQTIRQERIYEDDNYFVSQLYEENWKPVLSVF